RQPKSVTALADRLLSVPHLRRTVVESGWSIFNDQALATEVCGANDGNLVSRQFTRKSDRGFGWRAGRSGKTRPDAEAVHRNHRGARRCGHLAWTDGAIHQEINSE